MKFRLLILVLMVMSVVQASFGKLNYNVPRATVAPTIDGVLSANEWAGAMTVLMVYPDIVTSPREGALNSAYGPPSSADDLSAVWYLMWDNSALYVACSVWDSELFWQDSQDGPFSQDEVQLFFNFKNDPAAVYRAEAAIYDFAPRTNSSVTPHIYKRDNLYFSLPNGVIGSSFPGDGYIIEVKMPWADFDPGYVPAVNDIHGAGLVLLDYDDAYLTPGPDSSNIADFGKGSYTPSQVGLWNTLTLVTALTCGDNGYLPTDFNHDCVVNMADFDVFLDNWLVEY
jgi:hypothetical protein